MTSQARHGRLTTAWIFLAVTVCGIRAMEVIGCGSCPEPPVQKNFDITRYMGRWFEYVRFPNTFEMGSKCITANYTLNATDVSVRVVNSAIQETSYGLGLCPWYQSIVAEGNAIQVDRNESAKLGVRFSEYAPRGNYWVLETDYDNYAIVYGCSSYSPLPFHVLNAWVLTRQRGVAPQDLTGIYARLSNKGIDPNYFELTDHKGCPDWPKPPTS